MATRHLFYTLRMIWNHGMPEDTKLHPYQVYTFEPFYSEGYLRDAIITLHGELITRKDLRKEWAEQLNRMAMYFGEEDAKKELVASSKLQLL